MHKNTSLAPMIGVGILGLCIAGCVSRRVEPVTNGYEEVVYTWTSISEPTANQFALQYRKPTGGRVKIWPDVRTFTIKNDVAVFEGEVACEPRDPDEPRAMMSRLFAVKAPELPLDITDEVLWRWSNKNGIDFTNAVKIASVVTVGEKENHLEIRFAFWNNNDWPRIILLDWNEISDIMHEVKENGAVRKDRVLHTSYIEKEFKSGVQN
jgi:hypothetical protein